MPHLDPDLRPDSEHFTGREAVVVAFAIAAFVVATIIIAAAALAVWVLL